MPYFSEVYFRSGQQFIFFVTETALADEYGLQVTITVTGGFQYAMEFMVRIKWAGKKVAVEPLWEGMEVSIIQQDTALHYALVAGM